MVRGCAHLATCTSCVWRVFVVAKGAVPISSLSFSTVASLFLRSPTRLLLRHEVRRSHTVAHPFVQLYGFRATATSRKICSVAPDHAVGAADELHAAYVYRP